MRILKAVVLLLLAVPAALAAWLWFAPPDLIRVGSGYSAKIVCSNAFLTDRDPDRVLETDVQAPGHWLLRIMDVSVDREDGIVRAGLFGLFGRGLAVYREGQGCAAVPDGDLAAARTVPAAAEAPETGSRAGLWPEGDEVRPSEDPDLAAILGDSNLAGPGMRAIVVVKDGRIAAERYAEGFGPGSRLLGWSMTKTVTAAIIGTLVREGRLSLDDRGLFPAWAGPRSAIAIRDMLGMASDLTWNEEYGDVSDVTRMLYLEPDMAGFAAARPLDATTPGGIGEVFEYSSGTTVMLSRVWQDAFDDPAEALALPRRAMFGPLGMRSAVLETDERGTFVGSSYMYATARDWARFGQFLLQKGRWDGAEILPQGYVDWMVEPHPASGGVYGRGHVWLAGQGAGGDGLPEGTFFMSGHDGQSVWIIPSRNLVVVRLGLTPSGRRYEVSALVRAVIAALRG